MRRPGADIFFSNEVRVRGLIGLSDAKVPLTPAAYNETAQVIARRPGLNVPKRHTIILTNIASCAAPFA